MHAGPLRECAATEGAAGEGQAGGEGESQEDGRGAEEENAGQEKVASSCGENPELAVNYYCPWDKSVLLQCDEDSYANELTYCIHLLCSTLQELSDTSEPTMQASEGGPYSTLYNYCALRSENCHYSYTELCICSFFYDGTC